MYFSKYMRDGIKVQWKCERESYQLIMEQQNNIDTSLLYILCVLNQYTNNIYKSLVYSLYIDSK